MSCKIIKIENKFRQSNPELADKLNQLTLDTWNKVIDSDLFERKDDELYADQPGTDNRVKQNELIDSINNPTSKEGVNFVFESNPELANSVYEALGFETKLKTSLGKELEYKDPYAPTGSLKNFKQYQVLDEKNNDIGSVIIEYRGDQTVILHPKLTITGKGYGKDLYKLISSKFNVEIQEWNEGDISKSDSAKAMWDSLEKEGNAKRIVDEEQGDNFRVVKYNTQITPQQRQQVQQLYSQYLDTIFPDSKVKDIVYHFSTVKIDKPDKEKFSLSSNINRRKGFFGINKNINPGNNFANIEGTISHAMLFDMKNPDFGDFSVIPPVVAKDETKDSAIIKQRGDINYYSVFEPEQIHILGSKQDIEGFKEFVKEQPQTKDIVQITEDNKVSVDVLRNIKKYDPKFSKLQVSKELKELVNQLNEEYDYDSQKVQDILANTEGVNFISVYNDNGTDVGVYYTEESTASFPGFGTTLQGAIEATRKDKETIDRNNLAEEISTLTSELDVSALLEKNNVTIRLKDGKFSYKIDGKTDERLNNIPASVVAYMVEENNFSLLENFKKVKEFPELVSNESNKIKDIITKTTKNLTANDVEIINKRILNLGLQDYIDYKLVKNGDNFDISYFYEVQTDDKSNIDKLINKLQKLFPQIKTKIISEYMMDMFLDSSLFSTEDWNNLPSFVIGDTVYLIKNRYNESEVIEEFLHPFINSIYYSDINLFNSLLKEAIGLYPDLLMSITDKYQTVYSQEDINKEILTQALQRQYESLDKTTLLDKFLQWMKDLINSLNGKPITIDHLKNLNLSQLTRLLHNDEAKIFLDSFENKPYYHISDREKQVFDKIVDKQSANTVQKNVLNLILKNQKVSFIQEGHVYQTEEGETYQSITESFKGKLVDEQDQYAINRSWGNQLDYIAEQILIGNNLKDIDYKSVIPEDKPEFELPQEVIQKFFDHFKGITDGIRISGSIIVPQVVLNSEEDKRAGKPDFLVISTNGEIEVLDLKVSKNAIQVEGRKFDATFPGDIKVQLSTKEQHTIQTNAYAKILENYGLTVKYINTMHYILPTEGKAENIKVLPIEGSLYETTVNHKTNNPELLKLIDTIITTKVESILESSEGVSKKKFLTAKNLVDKLRIIVGNFEINLKTRHQKNPRFAEYVTDLSHFVATLELEDNPDEIYRNLLEYYSSRFSTRNNVMSDLLINDKPVTVKEINTFKFYKDEAVFLKEVLQQNEFLATNTSLKDNILFAQSNMDNFFTMYEELTNKHLAQSLENTLQQDVDTKILLDESLPIDTDINKTTLYARRMVESGDKLLTLVDTLYKNSMQRIKDYMKDFMTDIISIGNKVKALHSGEKGKEFYYMMVKNLKGDITGYITEALDYYKYIQVRDDYYKECYDEKGQLKAFIPITSEMSNVEKKTAKEHNISLFYARKKKREFDRSEYVIGPNLVDGDFHAYTDEYKAARDKVMISDIDEEKEYVSWKENPNVPLSDRVAFFDKYYTPYVTYYKAVTKKGVPTGEVVETKERFVKREYTEKVVNENNGLLNKDYQLIQSWKDSSNPEEKAKYDFYEFYKKTMGENLNKIPLDKALAFNGKMPRTKTSISTQASIKLPSSWLGVFSNTVKDFFSMKSEEGSVMVLADNEINDRSLPLMYMADFKSDRTIAFYENQKDLIKLLFKKTSENDIKAFFKSKNVSDNDVRGLFKLNLKVDTFEDYTKLLNKINNSLKIEKSRIDLTELETDLTKSLTAFTRMVNTYDSLSQIEDTIELIGNKIKNKKYKKESNVLDNLRAEGKKEEAFVKGANSNVYERYQKYLDMTFYKNVNPFNSTAGQISKKLMSVMSLRSVGLNPFGQFNNYLIGKVSNYIQANPVVGKLSQGLYWNGSHMNKAHKEYLLSTQNFFNKIEEGFYKNPHIKNNKYDAVVDYFNMERGFTPAEMFGQYGLVDKAMETAYALQQRIEYALQTQTGVSMLLAKELTHNTTGEKLSLYDALMFDKTSGKISGLKEGYEFSYEDKLNMTNYIYEVNAAIHGNYAMEDKMVIQSNLIGELVSVYRKHIMPNIDARFRKAYINDVRGWQEGRYRTAYQFFKTFAELKNIRESWDMLNEAQKINMKSNITELGFFLSTFTLYMLLGAMSSGDDGEEDSKLFNAFRVSVDRLNSDLIFYYPLLGLKQQAQQLKNPSAVLSYVGDIGDILIASTKVNKPYFENGVNKGELRIWKETKDVLPLLNLTNKWNSFETVKSYYIK